MSSPKDRNSNRNNSEDETGNTVPSLLESPKKPTAMKFISLGRSYSSNTSEMMWEESQRRKAEETKRNKPYGSKIPFTDTLLVDIVDKLTPCPQGEFATRVFRQHIDMGLCWHDSFFMMMFENQYFKANTFELLSDFFLELQANKIMTLEFDSSKTQLLASALKEHRNSSLPIGTWELVTLALQRYALLGLLFVKESQSEVLTKPVKTSRLLNRRPSVGELNFNYIHKLLKYGVMYCQEEGASKHGIKVFMDLMSGLVEELSKNTLKLELAKESLKPRETVGYYFSIQSHATLENKSGFVGGAHILSFFLCGGQWYLYDNETGVLPLSSEYSDVIMNEGIESIQILAERDMFVYPITLGNGEEIRVEMSHVDTSWNRKPGESRMVRARVVKDSSYRIVKREQTKEEAVGGRQSRLRN